MKILVYGAGVIGTLYAARLGSGGHQVTVLARSQRRGDTRQNGLVIEDVPSGVRSVAAVDTTERLGPDDRSDLAIMLDETGVEAPGCIRLSTPTQAITDLFFRFDGKPAFPLHCTRVASDGNIILKG